MKIVTIILIGILSRRIDREEYLDECNLPPKINLMNHQKFGKVFK